MCMDHEHTTHPHAASTTPSHPATTPRPPPSLTPSSSPQSFFFFNATATTEIYTLSLHDALPIRRSSTWATCGPRAASSTSRRPSCPGPPPPRWRDRKSTRLNSSHMSISYAVFCLKKKKKPQCQVNL